MTYVSISHATTNSAKQYIEEVHSEKNFCKKHVGARFGHLLLAPCSVVTGIADTLVGIGSGLGSIFTLGTNNKLFSCTVNHLQSSREILGRPFVHILKTINPDASFRCSLKKMPLVKQIELKSTTYTDPTVTSDGNGFITEYVNAKLKNIGRRYRSSENFFKRHIASRLTYLLLLISSIITRIVDGLIGITAAVFAIITLGKFTSLNNTAYRGLQVTGIIDDLFYCMIKMANPLAGV